MAYCPVELIVLVDLKKESADIGDDADEEKEVNEGPERHEVETITVKCRRWKKCDKVSCEIISEITEIINKHKLIVELACDDGDPPSSCIVWNTDDEPEPEVCQYCGCVLKDGNPHDHTNDSPHIDPANRSRGDY